MQKRTDSNNFNAKSQSMQKCYTGSNIKETTSSKQSQNILNPVETKDIYEFVD